MIRERLQISDTVKYPNQSFDAAVSAASAKQLEVSSAAAFNGSVAENNVGIAHSVTSTRISSSLSGDNYSIKSKDKFNMAAMSIGTADSSGATFTYKYWNGSTFATLTLLNTPVLTATGKKAILFDAPLDWALDADSYWTIRIDATTTPNFVFTSVLPCRVLAYREGVQPKATLEVNFEDPVLLQSGEGIVGFFSFADSLNTLKASYKNSP